MPKSRRVVVTQPAVLMAYAVLALALVPVFSWQTVESLQAGRALDAARLCAENTDSPCLERLPGRLTGPYGKRLSVNLRWEVGGAAAVTLGPHTSDELTTWRGDAVTALAYREDGVAVETPDGSTFVSLDVGARGAVAAGSLALLAAVVGAGCLRQARRKRRVFGRWWRADAPATRFTDEAAVGAAVGPASCYLLMELGASWQAALATAAALSVAALVAIARSRRRALTSPAPRHLSGTE